MNFNFSKGRITIVIAPVDMRCGFTRLSSMAMTQLNIDVSQGRDFVVFVSKRNNVCKMIWADDAGASMLTRWLHRGRFEQFLARADEMATRHFTFKDLESFLDGKPILVRRTEIHGG